MEKNSKDIMSPKPLRRRGLGWLSFLNNKYLLTGAFFLVWMFFFNEKDLVSEIKRKEKFKELQKSEYHLGEMIKETRRELGQLKTNAQTIEKYARENYLMKKDNEDLFIISATDANK
ncbi:MAG: septum formation initiator family protein [Ferruginibacter sp.]|nr:septum formation initiator family protein [Ferruginibacter sp.]